MSEISYAAPLFLYTVVYSELWDVKCAPVFAGPDPAFSKNFGHGSGIARGLKMMNFYRK
jgi:hypothetical protein